LPSHEPPRKEEADRLYAQYGESLEEQHRGQFVAISPAGQTMLGETVVDVLEKAEAAFGPGKNFVFKVGEKIVGKRRMRSCKPAAANWKRGWARTPPTPPAPIVRSAPGSAETPSSADGPEARRTGRTPWGLPPAAAGGTAGIAGSVAGVGVPGGGGAPRASAECRPGDGGGGRPNPGAAGAGSLHRRPFSTTCRDSIHGESAMRR
jgi:hypothetical protein